jgi:predicted RNA binding protein YcfA (HicA-like mRNA interferase family)
MSPRKQVFKAHELIKILEENGFTRISQKGSHIKMQNENNVTIVVPIHKGKDISYGLGLAILKQANIKPD